MGFGTIPRFWASQKITGPDLSQNAGIQPVPLDFGTLTATTEKLVRAPSTGYLAGASFLTSGTATLSASNYVTFQITNKSPGGTGTTLMLAATPLYINSNRSGGANAGAAIAAYQSFILTTAGMPAVAVNAGDCLAAAITVTGVISLAEAMWSLFFLALM
jgi:hypothetical protein